MTKYIIRTIKNSLGRYLAILAIIALGVGFFTGLKAARPAMMETGQEYARQQNLFDFRLISTWGFEEQEVEAIRELAGITVAEGGYWQDFIYQDEEDADKCLKALSIPQEVNQLTLVAGEMPQEADECVLDAYYYNEDMIGKEIQLAHQNSQETFDSFADDTYTVTGLVRSPIYMNMERGTTTIGNGKLDAFVYMLPEAFTDTYYKEVYVSTDLDQDAFTKAYQDQIDQLKDPLKEDVVGIVSLRYQQETADARQELSDAEEELDEKVADATQELADARQELEDGQEELEEGRQELSDAREELEAQEELYQEGLAAYEEGQTQYQEGLAAFQQAEREYEAGYTVYQENLTKYQQGLTAYQELQSTYTQLEVQLSQVGLDQATVIQVQLAGLAQTMEPMKQQLETAAAELAAAEASLLEGEQQLAAAEQELVAAERELAAAKTELDEGKIRLEEGKIQLQEAEEELQEAEQTLTDGWQEYEDGQQALEEETQEAEEKLADAREELDSLEDPEVYILGRDTNVGCASYDSDVSIVEGIAKVFPLFFFLIAALVCSTTMTRMVDDERTQIGTLRAMGYTEGAILWKYTAYSGSAAILGTIIGYSVGIRVFPMTIWAAYDMLYGFADIIIVSQPGLFLISMVVALLCSVGTTFAACRIELNHVPAELIRPKSPASGKRILLERMGFIWKHLRFLHKVSARNIFRFKKRMFMMILGIGGCMALVLTGFGLKDSISNIVNIQYDEILQYDLSAGYTRKVDEDTLMELQEEFPGSLQVEAALEEAAAEAVCPDGIKTVTLMVSEDTALMESVDFHNGDVSLEAPGYGEILIDNRLAKAMSLEIGDTLTLKSGEISSEPLKVAGIFENYTFYYAYITGETYQDYFGVDYEPKSLYLTLEDDADPYEIASYLADQRDVSHVTVIADTRARVERTMSRLNYVVALVIGCAAALAFIVLFNLGNINISERCREIATLKVLGFYPRETGAYVFRESVVLSFMGMVVGIPLGLLLHSFVMSQIQLDMVSFQVQILPLSYLYSVAAVLGFTVCVDMIMRRKIARIHMAESLKSIE